jgi:hypothetical protein
VESAGDCGIREKLRTAQRRMEASAAFKRAVAKNSVHHQDFSFL